MKERVGALTVFGVMNAEELTFSGVKVRCLTDRSFLLRKDDRRNITGFLQGIRTILVTD